MITTFIPSVVMTTQYTSLCPPHSHIIHLQKFQQQYEKKISWVKQTKITKKGELNTLNIWNTRKIPKFVSPVQISVELHHNHVLPKCSALGKYHKRKTLLKTKLEILAMENSNQLCYTHTVFTMKPKKDWRLIKRSDRKNHAVSFWEVAAFICWRCNAAKRPCQVSPGASATWKSRSFLCFL